jgi:quercetin dioxygenase-like cupin family protein
MDIKHSGSQASARPPADYFTGTVRLDPMFQAAAPARVSGSSVTFEPGARTAGTSIHLGRP